MRGFIWLLVVPYKLLQQGGKLSFDYDTTCLKQNGTLARFIQVITVKLPRETSFQLQRLVDISSYLYREEKQFSTRRTQIIAFTPYATELVHSYLQNPLRYLTLASKEQSHRQVREPGSDH